MLFRSLPLTSLSVNGKDPLLRFIPFEAPVPDRRVVIAWRKSFTRPAAIEAVRAAVAACQLPGVTMLDLPAAQQ